MRGTACRYQFCIKVSAHGKLFWYRQRTERNLIFTEALHASCSVLNIIVTEVYCLKDEHLSEFMAILTLPTFSDMDKTSYILSQQVHF